MGSPFKMNPKTPLMKALVGKQKNLPEHLKQAILDAPAKMTDKGKKKGTKKDDFRYESDMPEVIGTAYTKAGTERVTEYKKGGKTMKKGDTYERGGFQTPKKVVDTGRDAAGKKKAGQTGKVTVEVKKGDIRFSTGEKTKKKGASKSPAKMTSGKTDAQLKAQRGFTTGAGKGKRKVKTKTPTSIYVKKEKTASAITPRGVKKAAAKMYGKSPAKMKGVKALKKKK